MAKITLIGMYNYNDSLFDHLTVPESLDKDTLVQNILLRSGDFEIIYPDFDFLKFSIGVWSKKWQPTMARWVNALSIEYNPLENYNRIEEWSDNSSGNQSGTTSDTISGSKSGSSSGSTSGTTGAITTNSISAYDAGDSLTTRDQTANSGNDSSQSSSTVDEQSSETRGGTSSGEFQNASTHEGNVHGNIGVMSSQNMLMQEMDVGYWNIYEKLTDLFLTEFVLPIY